MHQIYNPEIVQFIDVLAQTGSNYRMDEMDALYTDDLAFLVLSPEGDILRFSKQQMFNEFRSRRDANEPPLSTEKRILHIEEQGDDATAILYRRMSEKAAAAIYELRLKKLGGKWKVAGETVVPWPDLATVSSFLPPREG